MYTFSLFYGKIGIYVGKGGFCDMWAYESVFYQIYPLGFCGAPFENDGKR